jgi:phosphatidylethanolamine-binding protein (PEBP) family uncharacterized protein
MIQCIGLATAVVTFVSFAAATAQSGFAVDFSWQGTASCFDPKSPPFTLGHVLAGTKSVRFKMADLDAPSFDHGGGTITFEGQADIPRGAFSYRGPCPPSGQHRYRWTIEALDASGTVLRRAQVMRPFPPN